MLTCWDSGNQYGNEDHCPSCWQRCLVYLSGRRRKLKYILISSLIHGIKKTHCNASTKRNDTSLDNKVQVGVKSQDVILKVQVGVKSQDVIRASYNIEPFRLSPTGTYSRLDCLSLQHIVD